MVPPASVPPGYTLGAHLGSGTTAHVYEAAHPRYGAVALKLPRPEVGPVLRRMFETEVQMTLALGRPGHPHVVTALAGYPTGAGAHLALERCECTLDALLSPALPLARACSFVLEVAQGLAHSHSRGVLHRDVKPANIFVCAGGAKLGDFGTGCYFSAAEHPAAPARVGTAFYMAPEIFAGAPATPSSDVYSLGVLAYEVIAGARPFDGESEDALMLAHTSGVPLSLRSRRGEVSLALERAVTRALSPNPSKRFSTVSAFAAAFAAAAELPATPAPPPLGRGGRTAHVGYPAKPAPAPAAPNRFGWFRRRR